jgi:hypothetical protein
VDRGKPDFLYSVRFCNLSLFARGALEDALQQGCKACTNLKPKFKVNLIGRPRKLTRSSESFHWKKGTSDRALAMQPRESRDKVRNREAEKVM